MPAPTVYKSTDTSAPVLDGQAGSLVNLLDKCLVAGYGSKTAAGWTKPYTATNKAVFLPSAGHYLDVDDSGAGAGSTKEGTVRGYESMTAVATGTNPFPTTAQRASPGIFIRKSVTADATARAWILLADAYTFNLFVLSGDTAGQYQSFTFGRFYSFKSSDTYRSVIGGHESTGSSTNNGGLDYTQLATDPSTPVPGWYTPRTYAGTGTSIAPRLFGVSSSLFGTPYNGPNAEDGNVYISRMFLGEASASLGMRGYLRGVYQILTAIGLNDGDTFTGTGDFASKTFIVLNKTRGGAYIALETTAWDSSA